MATFSRNILSGSTNGLPIVVSATATPGTLIHTAVTGVVSWDEVYAWVSNVTAAAATLTVQWGGVTDPASLATKDLEIPANSPPVPIMVGQVLNGGLLVRMFSNTAGALNVTGYINRIQ